MSQSDGPNIAGSGLARVPAFAEIGGLGPESQYQVSTLSPCACRRSGTDNLGRIASVEAWKRGCPTLYERQRDEVKRKEL